MTSRAAREKLRLLTESNVFDIQGKSGEIPALSRNRDPGLTGESEHLASTSGSIRRGNGIGVRVAPYFGGDVGIRSGPLT